MHVKGSVDVFVVKDQISLLNFAVDRANCSISEAFAVLSESSQLNIHLECLPGVRSIQNISRFTWCKEYIKHTKLIN